MAGLFTDNDDDQIAARLAHPDEPEEVPCDPVVVFLNRWCHRALGDRKAAEQELRALIAGAKK